ncbi:hypothetical protein Tco_1075091 [Tanacetum coccineum]
MEVSGNLVPNVFVAHYEHFLGTSMACNDLNVEGLLSKTVPLNIANHMGWNIIGSDICNAIRDFFSNGQLLKEINHTFLALIPKVPTPFRVNDFRPILCCNVIYKCISKIITNHIIDGIKEVVSDNQSAFIPGRRISDNILITQEVMHSYHKKKGPPRCAFKIDIQNAYDTVDWRFLEHILIRFRFHNTMVRWIRACVSSTSFSLSINGNIHGYFKGKRGLRQGDPLSPYLFTLVMEILTLILKRRVYMSDSFRFHHHCEEIQLINVCFVDDLFIFARGDIESSRVIIDDLEEFKLTSGLVPSIPKSMAYFCNVLPHTKNAILNIMLFSEGELPVKYLGVPLISSRQLQLCKSVISSMHVYWASILIIPQGIINDIHQLIRGFLWCNGEFIRGKAKAPDLAQIPPPALDITHPDIRKWRDRNGNMSSFSVAKAWEAIRPCDNQGALESYQVAAMLLERGWQRVGMVEDPLEELDRVQTQCVLFCDNQSAIYLVKNPVFHGRAKHIKIRYHYIRELVSKGMLSLKKILGEKNPADMLTNVVITEKLKLCAASTSLRDN